MHSWAIQRNTALGVRLTLGKGNGIAASDLWWRARAHAPVGVHVDVDVVVVVTDVRYNWFL